MNGLTAAVAGAKLVELAALMVGALLSSTRWSACWLVVGVVTLVTAVRAAWAIVGFVQVPG